MLTKKIRLATEMDCSLILDIYTPFITDTPITFEYAVPTIDEFKNRMSAIQKKYPWLVCEIDGKIVGYAYASQYRAREAYDWSVDFTVYINQKYHGKRIGKALYFCLAELLKLQGFYNAFAIVTLPNTKSEALHECIGFQSIGICQNVGYKLGKWRDVRLYEYKLAEHITEPMKPKYIDEIKDTIEFEMILKKAEQMINDL